VDKEKAHFKQRERGGGNCIQGDGIERKISKRGKRERVRGRK